MTNVTIHDVAERAGVSIGTVSAVINRKSTVSEATRRMVQEAIDALNYRPSAAARRRLQPSSEKSIGLVIKEVQNPYFADVIVGVQETATKHGYGVLVVSSERTYKLEQDLVELLVAKDVEGLIINPLLDDEADLSHLFELKRRNIPMVLLESLRGMQASMVDVDNVAASKKAVMYLIERGHKRIIHFAGPQYSMHSDERIEGVRRAFSAQRLVFDDHDVVHAGARLEDGYRAGLDFFRDRQADRPTAVTCYNDLVALGLIRALRELGLRVPADVSVIGYDDIDMASYASVPLTTVRVPKREMGAQAT
ncbi:MAG: LacI family DNA-binding transcriptional regulator, partial [Rhodothermales bacterium]